MTRLSRRAQAALTGACARARRTAGMVRLFKDAGLTPDEAAELLHIPSACVVGFGFATLWGRQAATHEAAAAGGADEPAPPAADPSAGAPAAAGAPAPADDLADYREAVAKWDPAQFAAALDIVLDAYGHRWTARWYLQKYRPPVAGEAHLPARRPMGSAPDGGRSGGR